MLSNMKNLNGLTCEAQSRPSQVSNAWCLELVGKRIWLNKIAVLFSSTNYI